MARESWQDILTGLIGCDDNSLLSLVEIPLLCCAHFGFGGSKCIFKYTLEPWLIRWEQSIQRSLLSADEKPLFFVKFNVDGLLRGDYASRMQGYATARQNGWMSANDIRELENLDRIPEEDGGDLYLINGNMLPLSSAGAFADITESEKEENSDEEVLEMEEPDDSGRTDAVPERHHRGGKLV